MSKFYETSSFISTFLFYFLFFQLFPDINFQFSIFYDFRKNEKLRKKAIIIPQNDL